MKKGLIAPEDLSAFCRIGRGRPFWVGFVLSFVFVGVFLECSGAGCFCLAFFAIFFKLLWIVGSFAGVSFDFFGVFAGELVFGRKHPPYS